MGLTLFGYTISRYQPTQEPPSPGAALSGYLKGETALDRLERIYADAAELLRRAHAGLPYSRRAMQPLGLGARRWQSAHLMCVHAAVFLPDGTINLVDPVQARRSLCACRDHYRHAMQQGNLTLPF
jgi:hypothetical protein